jgi:hypothetical protein
MRPRPGAQAGSEKARAALGSKFDLKAFHTVVLEKGAVPLTVLERLVDDWAGRSQPSAESATHEQREQQQQDGQRL